MAKQVNVPDRKKDLAILPIIITYLSGLVASISTLLAGISDEKQKRKIFTSIAITFLILWCGAGIWKECQNINMPVSQIKTNLKEESSPPASFREEHPVKEEGKQLKSFAFRNAITIFMIIGVVIALITFTLNPFRKRAGLLIMLLGVLSSLTIRLMIGLSMVGVGVMLLIIQFVYHKYC